MRIVIPDDYQDAARQVSSFGKLAGHTVTVYNDTTHDLDALAHRFGTADAVLLIRARTRIRDELLARLPRLRLISQTGHAVDHIDVAACARRGVLVASGGGDATVATAELTWGLVLAASRHIALEAERLRAGRWQTTIGRALAGSTLGILGYGRIGRAVAAYGDAFGMSVIVAGGREASRQSAEASGRRFVTDTREFFATADVVSVHLRLNATTAGSISAGDLAGMKPTSIFVNTSRAELVAPGALFAALRKGTPGFAAVDVFESEPVIRGSDPLLTLDNVVCTPHLGFVELDTYERYFGAAIDNIVAFASGRPTNIVNPESPVAP
jgi:D-3-phosphoglycerate dehydrogenase